MKDFNGVQIKKGDKVAYVSGAKNTASMAVGIVTNIYQNDKECSVDSNSHVYSHRIMKLDTDEALNRLSNENDLLKKRIDSYESTQITEYCLHCDTEQTVFWDVKNNGYEIFCPNCGKKIMLCSMCSGDCDWSEETGCHMKKKK